jgi:hypothetical protein
MTTLTRSPRQRWTSGGVGPVQVWCRAPTSDLGLELVLLAPPSSTSRVQRSPVELLPPPPITGQAPPPSLVACESEKPEKRTVVGSKRHASQRHAHWRNQVEREYGGKEAPTPSLFHALFSDFGLISRSFWR